MRTIMQKILLLALMISVGAQGVSAKSQDPLIQWNTIPDLPHSKGVAGPYTGVHNDALIVAGGAYFPESLFEGGAKVWTDSIFVLEKTGDGAFAWRTGFSLVRPLAYGTTIQTDQGLICIGGGDSEQFYRDVFKLQWDGGTIVQSSLPELPSTAALLSAAKVGEVIYVAGGQKSPGAKEAMKNFWALDLSQKDLRWKRLEPWPGPARILPVAGSLNDHFYLMSGAELVVNENGDVQRNYLTDAYRYNPENGWEKIAELPRPAVAAPSPTISVGQSHLLVFGGDDGEEADRIWELEDDHPGFEREVMAYHEITDTWVVKGEMPIAQVTTSVIQWDDDIIIPTGEVRPGTRTTTILQGQLVEFSPKFGALNYIMLVIYFAILLWMGYYFSKRESTTDDYFLGGKRIPWWAAGVSIFGTQLSAITFMAIPAKAYATNWVFFLANMGIVLIAPIIIYLYLPFYRRLNIVTAYQYLEKRFSVVLRLIGSAQYILLQLGRMAIVIFLPAIALSTVTGINIYLTLALMGLLSTVYTVMGGIEAVIWSDVMQAVVLLGGALLSLLIIFLDIEGGFSGFLGTAVANDKFHMFNWSWDWTMTAVWVVLVGNTINQLVPYSADQTVVQRYLTTSSEKEAAKSIWTNAILAIPASIIFFGVGTALFVFYGENPSAIAPTLQTDAIFPLFIMQELPAGIAGIVIAGVFAAAMSSLDSAMNSTATASVTDFYYRFHPDSSETYRLRLARVITVVLGFVATGIGFMMASMDITSLFDLILEIVALFGGSLAGLFALGIFTKRANATGAVIGMLTSMSTLILVKYTTDIHFFLYGGIGILVCMVVGYLFSLVAPGPEQELEGKTIYSIPDILSPTDN